MKEILFVIFFSSMLFLSINSVNAANDRLDWNDCSWSDDERTPLKKIGSDRLYCVTTETAKKLKERGWGTWSYGYFAHIEYVRQCGGLLRLSYIYVPTEETDDYFDWVNSQCQSVIFLEFWGLPNPNCDIHSCTLSFYNGTVYEQVDFNREWTLRE